MNWREHAPTGRGSPKQSELQFAMTMPAGMKRGTRYLALFLTLASLCCGY
jgi:hypothetical protein